VCQYYAFFFDIATPQSHPDLFQNDKTNAAIGLFEREGVANHPSDKGMRNIAS